ncbi:leucine-rich repeat domain-containing protein YddK-like [Anopheles cruzii]|uniref:leucine-rich repeat domain-containing protein YddK-like n=1 Tax=Anopheles cruzii TaxID=68878 RepID=UPI0022EC4614|nr:leucine-rich repeat domain-containing protein YddK-like [Anopheles cruzii]
MVSFLALLLLAALDLVAAGRKLECSEHRELECEISNFTIVEQMDLSEYEFPDHPHLAIGTYPLSDDSTYVVTITKELADLLQATEKLEIQNVSLQTMVLWSNLRTLDASHNSFYDLVVEPGHHYQLRELNLSFNRFQSIDFIQALPALRTLDLRHNYLETVDMSLFHMATDLWKLNLGSNRIQTLTTDGSLHLPRLSTLLLNDNLLAVLDGSEWRFSMLQELNLARNRLRYLSMCEVNHSFPHLQTLYLDENRWECGHLNSTVRQLQQLAIKPMAYYDVDDEERCGSTVEGICCY